MKRPALQNKQVRVLRMAFRARKVFGTFEKRAPVSGDKIPLIEGFSFAFTANVKRQTAGCCLS